jgi:hypothetical protein
MYTAILKLINKSPALYGVFETREEAEAHVQEFKGEYPEAFVYDGAYSPFLKIEADGTGVIEAPTLSVVPTETSLVEKIVQLTSQNEALVARIEALEGQQ